eukprot:jgi/Phyca11/535340/estExt2_fgenesh1_pg.C_PHYCAscaffold_340067
MGAQASRDAGAEPPSSLQDDRVAARAWRTGVPFTLLHNEGFVVEKHRELLAVSKSQATAAQSDSKALKETQTTASGLDEAPMDEMQHATDMARIKLFARMRWEETSVGEQGGSRPASPSNVGSAAAISSASFTETFEDNVIEKKFAENSLLDDAEHEAAENGTETLETNIASGDIQATTEVHIEGNEDYNKNAEVLRLLQDFVDPPEASDAEKIVQALQEQSEFAN